MHTYIILKSSPEGEGFNPPSLQTLRRWGYTAQRPKKLAYEQQPKRVQCWLDEEYPEIAKQAENEQAEIHWCDEGGIKQESQVLQSYSLRGKTPVVIHRSKRFSINMVSTVTNNGKLRACLESYYGSANFLSMIVIMLI